MERQELQIQECPPLSKFHIGTDWNMHRSKLSKANKDGQEPALKSSPEQLRAPPKADVSKPYLSPCTHFHVLLQQESIQSGVTILALCKETLQEPA